MSFRSIARQLGRRGGQMRAKRLSRDEKKAIASLGGKARAESLGRARRIQENFRYVAAIRELRLSQTGR